MKGSVTRHFGTFPDFAAAMDAMDFLVQHGYRQLHGKLELLVSKTTRIVPATAFGLPRGRFVVCTCFC
jgi:hypothetical protein